MLKKIWNWIKKKALAFHEWMKHIAPGVKTFIVAGLGAIGSLAATLQDYITGLPLGTIVKAEYITIATAVLFTLAFWFRGMASKG
jgi:hypothetical protein